MSSSGVPLKGSPGGPFQAPSWNLGRLVLTPKNRPLVMGILNLTPDSFYDGSRHNGLQEALLRARTMIAQGADILDLGAESSRPGARAITPEQEQERLLPVLAALREISEIPISVDTVRESTARQALAAGADAINDISGGRDPQLLSLAADAGCGLILMHMQGTPATMQERPTYEDPVREVAAWLATRCLAAQQAGVPANRLMVDPGIGFGKTLAHNLALLGHLSVVGDERPLLLGASRKSFIEHLTGAAVQDRLPGSLAALAAAQIGQATMVRVHDVAESIQFLDVLGAIPL